MSGHVPPPPMSPPPGGYPPQGPPSGPPSGPPYGSPPSGPPYGGPPYGGPPYGGPPYGGQPPGWGGQPPYGPPPGHGGPGSGGSRKGLWIGLGVLALVLVIGIGTAIGFAVTGSDDDGGDERRASDDNTSEPAGPGTPAETDEPAEPVDPEPEPAEPTESSESGPDQPSGTPFTAEYGSDVGDVCDGGAMTNAAAYDPAAPRISPFKLLPGGEFWLSEYVPSDQPYYVDYEKFEEVSVVACLTPGDPVEEIECESTDSDDKPITYTYATVPHSLKFIEASTGRDLGSAPDLEAPEATCPFVAFIENERAYSSIDDEALQAAITAYEFS